MRRLFIIFKSKAQGPRWRISAAWRCVDTVWKLMFALAMVAFSGCDLFDSAKVDNPVFGPPPPRNRVANDKSGHAQYVADPLSPDATKSELIGSTASSVGIKTASLFADGSVKQTGFSGQNNAKAEKIPDHEVVATVNGQPIFASEIFERAFPEQLRPDGMNLLYASMNLADGLSTKSGQVTVAEYRQLQELAIRKFLKEFIRSRVLVQAFEAAVPKEQKEKMEEALKKMCDEYVDKLQKEFKVNSHLEVDEKLRLQGTTVASLKNEFRYRVLSDEYLRVKSKKAHVVGRKEVLDYYEAHVDEYSYPEKVRWQLLQISFDKHHGQKGALSALEQAVGELEHGVDFGKVAHKYSDGLHADDGGKQPLTNPDSIREEKVAAILRDLPAGETSPVLTVSGSYRLIRIIERKAAGQQPPSEVQEEIRQTIEDALRKEDVKAVLDDLYQHASVESRYLTPAELNPAADFAGPSSLLKKSNTASRNGHKRS